MRQQEPNSKLKSTIAKVFPLWTLVAVGVSAPAAVVVAKKPEDPQGQARRIVAKHMPSSAETKDWGRRIVALGVYANCRDTKSRTLCKEHEDAAAEALREVEGQSFDDASLGLKAAIYPLVRQLAGRLDDMPRSADLAAVDESSTTSGAAEEGMSTDAAPPKYAEDAVAVWDTSLSLHETEYGEKQVRLALHYENKSRRRVVGVAVHVQIKNPFGKTVFEQTFEDEVVVPPMQKTRADTFWVLKDNPFINGEPYDRTWQMARQGTGTITADVKKAILDDGTVLAAKKAKRKKRKRGRRK